MPPTSASVTVEASTSKVRSACPSTGSGSSSALANRGGTMSPSSCSMAAQSTPESRPRPAAGSSADRDARESAGVISSAEPGAEGEAGSGRSAAAGGTDAGADEAKSDDEPPEEAAGDERGGEEAGGVADPAPSATVMSCCAAA